MRPGAREFIGRLIDAERKFLVMTNNSMYPPPILQHRLNRIGLDIPADRIHTSALTTAQCLDTQRPCGSAYVIGEDGFFEALEDIDYTFTDQSPDYVVSGFETVLVLSGVTTRAMVDSFAYEPGRIVESVADLP